MKAKSINDLIGSDGKIIDYKNPNCIDCNDCCSLFTQISAEEYKDLKKYFTKNKIGKSKYDSAVQRFYTMANELNGVYLVCPFSDRGKKCTIYSKRPTICREFHCSKGKSEEDIIKSTRHTIFDIFKEDIATEKRLKYFLDTYFGGQSCKDLIDGMYK